MACAMHSGKDCAQMRSLLFTIILLFAFVPLAPETSAQESTPSIIPQGVIEALERAKELCASCAQEDFFPLVHSDGVIDDHAVIFWPRSQPGTFIIPVGIVITIPDQDGVMGIYRDGVYDDVISAIIIFDDLTINEISGPISDAPASRKSWCTQKDQDPCGNFEYFPWTLTSGERFAYTGNYQKRDITVPNGFAVLVWNQSELGLYYSPGIIRDLPFSHMWAEVSVSG